MNLSFSSITLFMVSVFQSMEEHLSIPRRKSLSISDFKLHTVDCRSNIWGDEGDGKCDEGDGRCDKGDEIWCGLQCYNEALTIYVTKMAKLLQSHSTCNLPYFDK